MTIETYILDHNSEPVRETNFERWSNWFEFTTRILEQDDISKDVQVLTEFVGVDQNSCERGPALLWQTIVVGGHHDQYRRLYDSQEAALKGHAETITLIVSREKGAGLRLVSDSSDDHLRLR